jgi:hypothetical protein
MTPAMITGRKLLFVLIFLSLVPRLFGTELDSDTLRPKGHSHLYRNLVAGNIVVGVGAYVYFSRTWGAPNGKFHIKDEIHDNMAFNDEISHFFAGYKLTEGFDWFFRTLRAPREKSLKLAAAQAALILTLVEYPMDSYNPGQGMGLTDLTADYLGIGWSLLKRKYPNNFDMKFCLKQPPWKFENKFLASKNQEFDNWIWWANWKPKYVWTGVGYSTNHDQGDVKPEVYLGVGTTLYDLLHAVAPRLADKIKSLDTYFISVRYHL